MATRGTAGRRGLQGGEDAGNYGSYWRGLVVVVALWVAVAPASARSTLSARLDQPAIAGPALDQQSILYLHYFPGDGEAIVRSELKCLGNVRLHNARSVPRQGATGGGVHRHRLCGAALGRGTHRHPLHRPSGRWVGNNRLVRGNLLLAQPTGCSGPPSRIRPISSAHRPLFRGPLSRSESIRASALTCTRLCALTMPRGHP